MPNVIKPSQQNISGSSSAHRSNIVKLSGEGSKLNNYSREPSNITSDTVILSSAFEKAKKIVEAANTYSANHIKEATERLNQEVAETRKITRDEAYAIGLSEGKEAGYEIGYNEGKEAGYRDAQREGLESNKALLERLTVIVSSIEKARAELLAREEDNLSDLAVMIAEKVLNQTVDANKAVMGSIISRVVTDNQDQEWIKVNVSEDVYEDLDKTFFTERIQELNGGVTICPSKDLGDTDCVIEMPGYVTDASISTQLSKIKAVFKK